MSETRETPEGYVLVTGGTFEPGDWIYHYEQGRWVAAFDGLIGRPILTFAARPTEPSDDDKAYWYRQGWEARDKQPSEREQGLYEALEQCVRDLEVIDMHTEFGPDEEVLIRARAALSRARGETVEGR